MSYETETPAVAQGKSRKKIAIAVMAVAIIVVATFLVYWFMMKTPTYPWLFKGAYANYYGETTALFISVKLTVRLEVVDFNETHAKLLTYLKMDTPLGSREFQNTTWSDLTKKSYEMEGYNLKRSYDQEVYIENLGTRQCIIYEFESTRGGGTMTLYVDKQTMWPIKMKFSSAKTPETPSISLDLTLTETNIPGLKK